MIDKRIQSLRFLSLFIATIVLARLFYWQVIKGDFFKDLAQRQHTSSNELSARRGQIFANDGSLLVGTAEQYVLYAYRPDMEIEDSSLPPILAPILASSITSTDSGDLKQINDLFLKQETDRLIDRLRIDKNWVSLHTSVTREQKKAIEGLEIKGLGFDTKYIRFYPESSMSAQVLGFVGKDKSGADRGYFGLEGYFDRQLKGVSGKVEMERDALGNPIPIGGFTEFESRDGRDITTTIDRAAQYIVEKTLLKGIERYGAKEGNVIVLDTDSGAVIAMASYPNYFPGKFYEYPSIYHKNPNVANLFEPGSIFKPLVMAAALNEKLITPQTSCDICAGPISIGSFTIGTWNDEYHSGSSMTDVIINSDNTGMVFAARKLGKDKFRDYLSKYGLGQKTGIDLEDEVSGNLKESKEWREIDLATISFGQGIAITPIQMITAINVIANNGNWVRPYLVKTITQKDKVITTIPSEVRSVISQKARDEITEIMIKAVESGESKWAKPKDMQVAGKTGTAQIPVEGHYDEEKTIASFIGFTPANKPKFTMLVSLREPSTSQWGSETAAPLWFEIAKELNLILK